MIEQIRATAAPRVFALPRAAEPGMVEEVVTEAYAQHAERLRAFAIAAVRDGAEADDLVQETFLRLVRELHDGAEPRSIGAWLYRVCANLIVSQARRRSVADRMRALLVRRDSPASPEDEALDRERDRVLALALSRLSPDARVALLLAARGMAASEIGLAIHRTPLATRTFLFRSRVRLRDVLRELGVEDAR